jgi:hypothetical protein
LTRTVSFVASTISSSPKGMSIRKILADRYSRLMWSVRRNTAGPVLVS